MAFSNVTGKVGRTFFEGKGAEIVESWTSNGETYTKRWSAFFEQPHGLVEGADVTVSGIHGDKVDSWDKDGETRHSVKRTLNKAKIKGQDATAAPQATEPAPADTSATSEPADVWNMPSAPDSELPF